MSVPNFLIRTPLNDYEKRILFLLAKGMDKSQVARVLSVDGIPKQKSTIHQKTIGIRRKIGAPLGTPAQELLSIAFQRGMFL